jgi:hypothetical protein
MRVRILLLPRVRIQRLTKPSLEEGRMSQASPLLSRLKMGSKQEGFPSLTDVSLGLSGLGLTPVHVTGKAVLRSCKEGWSYEENSNLTFVTLNWACSLRWRRAQQSPATRDPKFHHETYLYRVFRWQWISIFIDWIFDKFTENTYRRETELGENRVKRAAARGGTQAMANTKGSTHWDGSQEAASKQKIQQ